MRHVLSRRTRGILISDVRLFSCESCARRWLIKPCSSYSRDSHATNKLNLFLIKSSSPDADLMKGTITRERVLHIHLARLLRYLRSAWFRTLDGAIFPVSKVASREISHESPRPVVGCILLFQSAFFT